MGYMKLHPSLDAQTVLSPFNSEHLIPSVDFIGALGFSDWDRRFRSVFTHIFTSVYFFLTPSCFFIHLIIYAPF